MRSSDVVYAPVNWWSRSNRLVWPPATVNRSRPVVSEPVLDALTAKVQGRLSFTVIVASMRSGSSPSRMPTCTCLFGFSLAMAVCTARRLKLGVRPSCSSGSVRRTLPSL